ncbi:MAG TPA: pitrilysin family protein, partial [Kutzneria sp.]|nr:pitrilysin family protein [Kutzneria sp.]
AEFGGIAHLLEHLLMSTPVAGLPSFSEHVERLGGYANAQTAPELMQFYAQVHADDADEIAELLHTAVLTPSFDAKLLDAERTVVLQELATGAADPADAVQDAILAELFAGHPLGRPVGGVPAELEAMTVDDVLREHTNTFLRSPMVLVVVGPRIPKPLLASPAVRPSVRGDVTAPALAAPRGVPAWPLGEDLCWVCLGAPSPAATDARRFAFTLLAKLLGSSPSSLLYRSLRGAEGISYSFQAWNRGYTEIGAWRLLAGVQPSSAQRLLDIVHGLLADLAAAGPSPADLDAARRQAVMSLVRAEETPIERANLIGRLTAAGTIPWSVDDDLAQLRAVTVDDIRAAATEVARALHVTVRPEAS